MEVAEPKSPLVWAAAERSLSLLCPPLAERTRVFPHPFPSRPGASGSLPYRRTHPPTHGPSPPRLPSPVVPVSGSSYPSIRFVVETGGPSGAYASSSSRRGSLQADESDGDDNGSADDRSSSKARGRGETTAASSNDGQTADVLRTKRVSNACLLCHRCVGSCL